MTKEHLYTLIENPARITKEDALPLEALCQRYPAFQPARMLYLKALQLNRDPRFAEELRRQAPFVNDLKGLFHLLADKQLGWNEAFEMRLRQMEQSNKPLPAPDTLSLIDSFLSRSWGDVAVQSPGVEAKQEPLSEPLLEEEIAKEIDAETIENLQLESEAQIAYAAYDYVSSLAEAPDLPEEGGADSIKHTEMIDCFISRDDEARVSPKEKRPATRSIEPSEDDLFTESLAKIYIRQKRYSKALEIIKRLSLKYPKKSIYFADQIRYLELLIENIKKQ